MCIQYCKAAQLPMCQKLMQHTPVQSGWLFIVLVHCTYPNHSRLCCATRGLVCYAYNFLYWLNGQFKTMITTSNNVDVVWFLTICYINGLLKWVKLGRWSLLTIHTQIFVALFNCTSASLNFYNSSFLISVCFPVHMHSLLDFNNCNNICPALI